MIWNWTHFVKKTLTSCEDIRHSEHRFRRARPPNVPKVGVSALAGWPYRDGGVVSFAAGGKRARVCSALFVGATFIGVIGTGAVAAHAATKSTIVVGAAITETGGDSTTH